MLHIAASAMTPADISWDFIIGGLALFLFGIQFMGDGLKSIAGEKLREYIDRYTNKPWKGILVGSIITVFIQSSSATSAIAIGFVRAGLMSLEQSIGIIIGANIGTTVTAFLIGLKVEALALYFVFLGVLITLFAKRKKQTYMGQIVLGFGLLFFGLRLMGDELSKLGQMDFFTTLATTMQNQPILGFISGTLMTAIVLFNTIGSVIFMFLLTPYVDFIAFLSDKYSISPMMQIAIAHILRTIVISILAYPCINLMVSVIKKIIPGEEERIEVDLEGLDPKLAASLPAGALGVSKQVTVKMGELASDCIRASQEYFNKKSGKYRGMSSQYEDAINSLDSKITEYLMTIAHNSLSEHDTDEFINNLQIIKNIERVGDLTMNLNEFYELTYEDKGAFTDEAVGDVNEMYETVLEMNEIALNYFSTREEHYIQMINDKENYLDLVEEKARQRHFKRMAGEVCGSGVAASIFVDILGTLERIGDHIWNIVKEGNEEAMTLDLRPNETDD